MIYFYARVSTKEQNLARQIKAAHDYKKIDKVFEDKRSGKDLQRPQYQEMKGLLTKGDEVVVHSLDRLGRNKEDIKNEIAWFKANGIVLRVLDLPTTLIDFNGQEWIGDMVTNIMVEVLASVAQQEREKIKTRQAEGIAAMQVVGGKKVSAKTGRVYGRPAADVEMVDFQKFREKQKDGEITVENACAQLGISRSTWYAKLKEVV